LHDHRVDASELAAGESPAPGVASRSFALLGRLLIYVGLYAAWIAWMLAMTGGFAETPSQWASGWFRWDAQWYEQIWRVGYQAQPFTLVFPPGFSYLCGALSAVSGMPFGMAACLLNALYFLIAGMLCAELLYKRFQVAPLGGFLFFLSAPASYFAFVPYSDAVFLMLFWCALHLGLREPGTLKPRHWILGSLLFLAIPSVRIVGYSLLSWVLLRRWYVLALLPALGLWMLLNQHLAGSPLAFLHMQAKFLMPQGTFDEGLVSAVNATLGIRLHALSESQSALTFGVLPLAALLLLGATTAWMAWRREWLLALTLACILFVSHNQSYWRSVVRYDWIVWGLMAAPLLGLRADAKRPGRAQLGAAVAGALILCGFLLQLVFAKLFRLGHWAF
jgi:hypothetical protein